MLKLKCLKAVWVWKLKQENVIGCLSERYSNWKVYPSLFTAYFSRAGGIYAEWRWEKGYHLQLRSIWNTCINRQKWCLCRCQISDGQTQQAIQHQNVQRLRAQLRITKAAIDPGSKITHVSHSVMEIPDLIERCFVALNADNEFYTPFETFDVLWISQVDSELIWGKVSISQGRGKKDCKSSLNQTLCNV